MLVSSIYAKNTYIHLLIEPLLQEFALFSYNLANSGVCRTLDPGSLILSLIPRPHTPLFVHWERGYLVLRHICHVHILRCLRRPQTHMSCAHSTLPTIDWIHFTTCVWPGTAAILRTFIYTQQQANKCQEYFKCRHHFPYQHTVNHMRKYSRFFSIQRTIRERESEDNVESALPISQPAASFESLD